MKFKDLCTWAEFVMPNDPLSQGKLILQKVPGRKGVWANLATDEKGHEHVINPEAEVALIESSKTL